DCVFCAGPIGPAGISPAQDQLPSNVLSWAISGAGFGMAGACANVQGASSSVDAARAAPIDRDLMCPPEEGRLVRATAARNPQARTREPVRTSASNNCRP